ncbi:MAG: alpha/beta fold hydrolase [Gammaproteobacteria bacterium]|nr:alpha/beta fold hydrolase [Gammaproteobacteria bacterium]
MDTIILTGATGFLGSHFLLQALRAENIRVICIGRAKDATQLAERIESALNEAAMSYTDRIQVPALLARCIFVCGDLGQDQLGIGGQLDEVRGLLPSAFWHFAASLQYEDANKDLIEVTNIGGTQRALQLAQCLDIRRFFYVSTAYVNGALSGAVGNTVNETGRFNNHYERTKQMAEKLVMASGLDYAIVRPSIVIGNSQTYQPGGAKTGFYSFLRELKKISKIAEKQNVQVRVKANRASYLNLIPVDHFIRDCWAIAQLEDRSVRVFNCTADQVCQLDDMEECLDFIDVRNVDVVDDIDDMSPIEVVVDKRTAFFASYINNPGLTFIRTAPGTAGVTARELNQYAANGLNIRSSTLFAAVEHLARPGGGRLRYRCIEESRPQAVIIVNAYGMPFDFWEHIVEMLRSQFDIYALEFSRSGERNVPSEFLADVDDIVALAEHIGRPVHLLSWCSGSMLALMAATRIPLIRSSVHISGGYILAQRSAPMREVATVTRRLYERVASSEAAGRGIFNALFRNMRSNIRWHGQDARDDIALVLSTMNPAYLDWIAAIFDDFSTFRDFATKRVHLWQSPVDEYLDQIKGRTLFLIGSADESVDPAVTQEVAKLVPGSECCLLEEGDHWVLHSDARVHNTVSAFLESCA